MYLKNFNQKTILAVLLFFSLSIQSFSQPGMINPIEYFSAQPKRVIEHSYFANISIAEAIKYFKKIGLIQYSERMHDPSTIRFKNSSRSIFIMLFRKSPNKVYIVMSRTEFVDEIDA